MLPLQNVPLLHATADNRLLFRVSLLFASIALARAVIRYNKVLITQTRMITTQELIQIIKDVTEDDIELLPDSSLVGGGSIIDSMGLVQICLALEERSQSDGFSFDWTSEKAMSSLNSIFKNPDTLAQEYNRQLSAIHK